MQTQPLVTVLIISYNHVNSFENAIQSVLSQKTNFDYQISIYDDASTDGTSELIKKYADYPNVNYVIREQNIGSSENIYDALKSVNTKYYAILESDDYWCDDNKLQTQVDILENNPDCSFCAHNTLIKNSKTNKTSKFFKYKTQKFSLPIPTDNHLAPHTSSRLYRTECLNLSEIKNKIIATYDIANNFYFFTKGNLYYLDKVMSVYNYTGNGIYSSLKNSHHQSYITADVFAQINEEFNYKYNKQISKIISKLLNLYFFTYLKISIEKNPAKLAKQYKKIFKKYKKNFIAEKDIKSLCLLHLPLTPKKTLVFEIRREKIKK